MVTSPLMSGTSGIFVLDAESVKDDLRSVLIETQLNCGHSVKTESWKVYLKY